MKFVPVPITGGPTDKQRVLFSVWDTRVQDYEAFQKETNREWPKPDFQQGPTHPAVMLSWEDAQAFCQWLTERERKEGRIGAGERYRLPSDHEWSCAVGIGDKESATPGVGLGLAISRAIVQAHGGTIRGENRAEPSGIAGARFTIELPRGSPPGDDGSTAAAAGV